jgi:hypothetical protein
MVVRKEYECGKNMIAERRALLCSNRKTAET